jgi:hypothetical protein
MAIKFLNTVQVDTDVLYVDASTNRVGIGTTSPSTVLEVSSTGVNGVDISQSASNASQSGRLFFTTNTASEGFALFNANGTFQINSGGIPNDTSGNNRISIIGSSGNVGIGTTSPNHELVVEGGASSPNIELKNTSYSNGGFVLNRANYTQQWKWWAESSVMYFGFSTDESTYSNKLVIKSNGNVGIGTTSPSSILHLEDSNPTLKILSNQYYNSSAIEMGNGVGPTAAIITCSNNPAIAYLELLYDNGASGDSRIRVGQNFLDFGIDNSNAMYINSSKNVGIGTTIPSQKLEVAGNVLIKNNTLSYLYLNNTDNFLYGDTYGNTIIRSANNFRIQTKTSGGESVRVDSAGDVGIGTTALTTISSTVATLSLGSSSTSTSGGIAFQVNGVVKAYNYVASNYLYNQTVAGIGQIFYGAGSERMRIHNTTGNVGIGTTSPGEKLEIVGNIKVSGDQYFNGSVIEGDGKEIIRYSDSWLRINEDQDFTNGIYCGGGILRTDGTLQVGSSGSRFIVNSSGNVGISDTTPSYKLDVNGEGRFAGDLRCLSLIQTSQSDKKESISDIVKTTNKKIEFKEYVYKSDSANRKRYGVLAEDIEVDYPELVHVDADGIKGVNYIDLLVKRVSELEKEIEDIAPRSMFLNWRGYHSSTNNGVLYDSGWSTNLTYPYATIIAPFKGSVTKVSITNNPYSSYQSGPTGDRATLEVVIDGRVVDRATVNYSKPSANEMITFNFSGDHEFSENDKVQLRFQSNGLWRYINTGIQLKETI